MRLLILLAWLANTPAALPSDAWADCSVGVLLCAVGKSKLGNFKTCQALSNQNYTLDTITVTFDEDDWSSGALAAARLTSPVPTKNPTCSALSSTTTTITKTLFYDSSPVTTVLARDYATRFTSTITVKASLWPNGSIPITVGVECPGICLTNTSSTSYTPSTAFSNTSATYGSTTSSSTFLSNVSSSSVSQFSTPSSSSFQTTSSRTSTTSSSTRSGRGTRTSSLPRTSATATSPTRKPTRKRISSTLPSSSTHVLIPVPTSVPGIPALLGLCCKSPLPQNRYRLFSISVA